MEWLRSAVIEGLQRLLVLRLPNSPAADTIVAVAEVWISAFQNQPITWNFELDALRISKAFLRATAECVQWPAPANVLILMPGRKSNAPQLTVQKKYSPMPANIRSLLDEALYAEDRQKKEEKEKKHQAELQAWREQQENITEHLNAHVTVEMIKQPLQFILTEQKKDLKAVLKELLTTEQFAQLNINL